MPSSPSCFLFGGDRVSQGGDRISQNSGQMMFLQSPQLSRLLHSKSRQSKHIACRNDGKAILTSRHRLPSPINSRPRFRKTASSDCLTNRDIPVMAERRSASLSTPHRPFPIVRLSRRCGPLHKCPGPAPDVRDSFFPRNEMFCFLRISN